jgi:hypothetical protein
MSVASKLTPNSDPALESRAPLASLAGPSQFVANTNSVAVTPNINNGAQVIGPGSNVLNNYRSATYNFTLASLRKDWTHKPENYTTSLQHYVIAKTGGKGASGITGKEIPTLTSEQIAANKYTQLATEDPTLVVNSQNEINRINGIPDLISKFNEKSSGRFDFFIDNVEIVTLMSFNPDSGPTLPVKFRFEIYEPYSINGFIEALQVSAVAAGYPSYASASFLLKVEFLGYPDGPDIPDPKRIDDHERYFPIMFTGLEVEVTEQGTRYICAAMPYNDRLLGIPNRLKQPVTVKGTTVRTILEDMLTTVNEQIKESDEQSGLRSSDHDSYHIKFLNWDNEKGFVEAPTNTKHEIGDVALSISNSSNNNDQKSMGDPGNSNILTAYTGPGRSYSSKRPSPNEDRLTSFRQGRQIHECISDIIRDSEYLTDRLKNLKPDIFGMIDYFVIKSQVENKETINPQTGNYFQKYTYLISPYKIYYKRIPGFQVNRNTKQEQDYLNKASVREYNYIYTGNNIDVLSFKINFNNLYFSAMPFALGKNDFDSGKFSNVVNNGSKPTGNTVIGPNNSLNTFSDNANTVASTRVNYKNTVPDTGSGMPIQYDQYSILARNLHSAIVNSFVDMIRGEITILGDPVFLVTGGMNGQNLKPITRGLTELNQANHMYGQININVNFRNPIDIDSFENGGTMYFDPGKAAFSGVYMVNTVVSSFREGKFTQRIQMVRIPNQYEDDAKAAPTTSTIANVFIPDTNLVNQGKQ